MTYFFALVLTLTLPPIAELPIKPSYSHRSFSLSQELAQGTVIKVKS